MSDVGLTFGLVIESYWGFHVDIITEMGHLDSFGLYNLGHSCTILARLLCHVSPPNSELNSSFWGVSYTLIILTLS